MSAPVKMDAGKELPDPDWDEIWKDDCSRPLVIFKLYARLRKRSYRRLLSGIDLENKNIIELGGGSGHLTSLVGRDLQAAVTLIDNSRQAIEFSKKFKISGVNYLFGDMFEHRGSYDLVLSDGLIEHFRGAELSKVIRLHSELVKDEGHIAVFVPRNSFFVRRFLSLKGAYEKKYGLEEFIRALKENGLEVKRTVVDFHMLGALCVPAKHSG
jgi:2-polyprenyl-3-methyl-5-hydroxy-6-metoxy-1,4-benzoquinol methylase